MTIHGYFSWYLDINRWICECSSICLSIYSRLTQVMSMEHYEIGLSFIKGHNQNLFLNALVRIQFSPFSRLLIGS
jgi:hypothetical protein